MGLHVIDLSREATPLARGPIGGARAWLATNISEDDWLVRLDSDALGEIERMVAQMKAQPLPTILRSVGQFDIPNLRKTLERTRSILDDGCGFAVLDGLPMDGHDADDMVACFWVLGQMIGTPVAQKWNGTMIYDVTDTGVKYGYGVRGSATNVELVFHTDNAFGVKVPEYVGLLCKYPALEGGTSRFCSLYSLHNRLAEECPELLERLYQPMLFDRQAEHADGAPKTSLAPFFSVRDGRLAGRANVSLVRKGYDVAGETMDPLLAEALEAVQRISSSTDLWCEAPLKRGQIQYLNNHELGHYRSEFSDNPDPALKRHLYRTWHRETGLQTYDGI
ncbi:MAG: TauD/TfdA family dioxygenase [Hyphomicrobiaceae bacterium]